ncbi:MAG: type I 3-dehydroquinate dehydratase [Promethearchaeota archaeon]|jgi:3-dehydroquinate dehydratase-1
MKYRICIAIPIKSRDLNVNKDIIEKALDNDPDLIEFRFDYIQDIKYIISSFLTGLLNCIPSEIPKIFTFRGIQEGGQNDLSSHERLDVLKLLIEAKPDYLDIEINSESEVLKTIIELAHQNEIQLIFSYHNFEKSISTEETAELLKRLDQKIKDELLIGLDKLSGSVFKIITTAQNFDDNVIVLNTCKKLSQQNRKFICFAMGELGLLSRILCVKFGSLWTYGSLEDRTAPGQIKIEKIREIHQLLFDN